MPRVPYTAYPEASPDVGGEAPDQVQQPKQLPGPKITPMGKLPELEVPTGGDYFHAGSKSYEEILPPAMKAKPMGEARQETRPSEGAPPASRAAKSASAREVIQGVSEAWGRHGMSKFGIHGVVANIEEESGFNPRLRHPDQPKFGGEAHFAHGLYQEGGDEWNKYARWINTKHPGADWRDHNLQSEFAAWNLKTFYPKTWEKMVNAKSPTEAASIYVREYLKPAKQYQTSRIAKFSRGLPDYGIPDYKSQQAEAE